MPVLIRRCSPRRLVGPALMAAALALACPGALAQPSPFSEAQMLMALPSVAAVRSRLSIHISAGVAPGSVNFMQPPLQSDAEGPVY